ncbi:type I-E CRISPR-associated protein Cse1/CasA [Actinomadura graeca]|uniref:type I-E CRISPR-associated protein Cse1/CasA n=1 Tax=Actinomadura graeca TaxID=2750812 RepID=UPI003B832695
MLDVVAGLAQLGSELSEGARQVWAKHDRDEDDWLPLWRHLADSGAVAALLWDQWLPVQVQDVIAASLPGGAEDARRLVVWSAATHDIGKATPAFACQVEVLADGMRRAGLDMPLRGQMDDRRLAPHGLAGMLLLHEWLMERYGWRKRWAWQWAVVAGGHHGVPPSPSQIRELAARPRLLRSPGSAGAWRDVQWELLEACARACGVDERLPQWREVKLPQPAQALLTGVVIVADWIASNVDLFPYVRKAQGSSDDQRVEAAWRGLALPRPWRAAAPGSDVAELFTSRFDLPAGARIRPLQERAVQVADGMAPGLMIIEGPMGEGKTEAALAVAEIFASRSGAGGVFVALPTIATSNAMFSRVLRWLRRLPDARDGAGAWSVQLAHSKAALNEDFRALTWADLRATRGVQPDEEGSDGAAVLLAHQWLRGRKKGMLASFGIGTIDQLLFMGLKSRHLALRHLALAGKVVIIDEAHAYDAYMNSYLDLVLSWLGAYGVPVVVLSATLPSGRRRELVEAYCGAGDGDAAGEAAGYPLITVAARGGQSAVHEVPASGRRTEVLLEPLDDDLEVLGDRLDRALAAGGCVLVVRNTVDRVLQTAAFLRGRLGAGNVSVAHARFLDLDRMRKDADLVKRFGPPGASGDRPDGPHVVVASQVAEQSLDIDFDLLVSDLCPVDLLLQRMGRLHRHQRGEGQSDRPEGLRQARCLVTGADWGAAPVEPVAGSQRVYQRHVLLRTAAVLWPLLTGVTPAERTVRLPEDISPLVQSVYGPAAAGPLSWQPEMDAAHARYRVHIEKQRKKAEGFRLAAVGRDGSALLGWIDAGVGDADDTPAGRAQVRDGVESLEVLVVQRLADGTVRTLPWLDAGRGGCVLPTDAVPEPRLARIVAACALRLPFQFTIPGIAEQAIAELEEEVISAWQFRDSSWLAGELILFVDEDCRTRLAGYELSYHRDDGLKVTPAGAGRTARHAARAEPALVSSEAPSFDLTRQAWIPVLGADGTSTMVSLREVFVQAPALRRLAGDLPTQDFALMRLLLAILHDALEGPQDLDEWEELWSGDLPVSRIQDYLDEHCGRFDLLHPRTPFLQTPSLRTARNEVSSLNKIVADVPNGAAYFTMRGRGAERLGFAEAARWLVHVQAFDTSGIKSGAVGDPRVKGGRGYPQGVAWAGNLGGVLAAGEDLRETLLLNLIAFDTTTLRIDPEKDRPIWRREPLTAAPMDEAEAVRRPYGLRELYTWPSRRVRLHFDGRGVHGVVLAYGDALAPGNRHAEEPMTAWRRSPFQERKLKQPQVYLPRLHDPSRSAWRGLGALVAGRAQGSEQRQEAAQIVQPQILHWLARLTTEGPLPPGFLVRTRLIGAVYGTQQSVIDEVIDDEIRMPVVLLHEQDAELGMEAIDAVFDAENAVAILADLAADLARAAGDAAEPRQDAARGQGFGSLDGPFRHWLAALEPTDVPRAARATWQRVAHQTIRALGQALVEAAGPSAWEGRVVTTNDGRSVWLSSTRADQIFTARLAKALPGARAHDAKTDAKTEAPA